MSPSLTKNGRLCHAHMVVPRAHLLFKFTFTSTALWLINVAPSNLRAPPNRCPLFTRAHLIILHRKWPCNVVVLSDRIVCLYAIPIERLADATGGWSGEGEQRRAAGEGGIDDIVENSSSYYMEWRRLHSENCSNMPCLCTETCKMHQLALRRVSCRLLTDKRKKGRQKVVVWDAWPIFYGSPHVDRVRNERWPRLD